MALTTDQMIELGKMGTSIWGGIANARAQNKSADANLGVARVGQELDSESEYQRALAEQARIDMDRRELDSKSRDDAYRSALLAGLTKGFQPTARPDGVANISFIGQGVTPEMLEAAEMRRVQSMDRLENGQQFDPMEAPRRVDVGSLYQQMQEQEAAEKKSGGNIFGKILKIAGTGASFIPGVGQIAAPILAGAGGLVSGDGLKKSLLNAGMAAIPFGAGKLAKTGGVLSKVGQLASKTGRG